MTIYIREAKCIFVGGFMIKSINILQIGLLALLALPALLVVSCSNSVVTDLADLSSGQVVLAEGVKCVNNEMVDLTFALPDKVATNIEINKVCIREIEPTEQEPYCFNPQEESKNLKIKISENDGMKKLEIKQIYSISENNEKIDYSTIALDKTLPTAKVKVSQINGKFQITISDEKDTNNGCGFGADSFRVLPSTILDEASAAKVPWKKEKSFEVNDTTFVTVELRDIAGNARKIFVPLALDWKLKDNKFVAADYSINSDKTILDKHEILFYLNDCTTSAFYTLKGSDVVDKNYILPEFTNAWENISSTNWDGSTYLDETKVIKYIIKEKDENGNEILESICSNAMQVNPSTTLAIFNSENDYMDHSVIIPIAQANFQVKVNLASNTIQVGNKQLPIALDKVFVNGAVADIALQTVLAAPYAFYLNGATLGTKTVNVGWLYNIGIKMSGSTDIVQFGYKDPLAFKFDLDSTKPSMPVMDPVPATPTKNTQPTWKWKASPMSGGNGIFKYSIDNGAFVVGATTSFTPISALAEGSHTLTIAERNAAGTWSDLRVSTIEIDTTSPSLPQGISPSASLYLLSSLYSVSWTASVDKNLLTHRIKACSAQGCSSCIGETTALNSPTQITGFVEGVSYNICIRGEDKAGNSSLWATSTAVVMRDETAPSIPAVTDPASNYLASTSYTLFWQASSDAASGLGKYQVKVCTGSCSCTATPTEVNFNSTSYLASGLATGQTYYFCVQAIDKAGNASGYGSTTTPLTVDTSVPSKPTVIKPAASSTALSFLVSWLPVNGSSSGISKYNVKVCTTNDCGVTGTCVSAASVDSSVTSTVVSGLTNTTSYYSCVQAVNGAGTTSSYGVSLAPIAICAAPGCSCLEGAEKDDVCSPMPIGVASGKQRYLCTNGTWGIKPASVCNPLTCQTTPKIFVLSNNVCVECTTGTCAPKAPEGIYFPNAAKLNYINTGGAIYWIGDPTKKTLQFQCSGDNLGYVVEMAEEETFTNPIYTDEIVVDKDPVTQRCGDASNTVRIPLSDFDWLAYPKVYTRVRVNAINTPWGYNYANGNYPSQYSTVAPSFTTAPSWIVNNGVVSFTMIADYGPSGPWPSWAGYKLRIFSGSSCSESYVLSELDYTLATSLPTGNYSAKIVLTNNASLATSSACLSPVSVPAFVPAAPVNVRFGNSEWIQKNSARIDMDLPIMTNTSYVFEVYRGNACTGASFSIDKISSQYIYTSSNFAYTYLQTVLDGSTNEYYYVRAKIDGNPSGAWSTCSPSVRVDSTPAARLEAATCSEDAATPYNLTCQWPVIEDSQAPLYFAIVYIYIGDCSGCTDFSTCSWQGFQYIYYPTHEAIIKSLPEGDYTLVFYNYDKASNGSNGVCKKVTKQHCSP